MSYIEMGKPPIEGALNTNEFVQSKFGLVLLKRVPKDNQQVLDSIAAEYGFIGFFDEGGSFKRRTFQEQLNLSEDAAFYNLRVLLPISTDDEVIYYPYLEDAVTYDDFLSSASTEEADPIIDQLFDDLRSAHHKGVVYGDRWPPNILIVPNEGVVNIDFDIELSGFPAIEFEVAQIIFYTLASGGEKVLSKLSDILNQSDGWFNYLLVKKFLIGHGKFFDTEPEYGNTKSLISKLV